MRKMTVPLTFAAAAALAKRKIYNEGPDEWAYKGGKHPAS